MLYDTNVVLYDTGRSNHFKKCEWHSVVSNITPHSYLVRVTMCSLLYWLVTQSLGVCIWMWRFNGIHIAIYICMVMWDVGIVSISMCRKAAQQYVSHSSSNTQLRMIVMRSAGSLYMHLIILGNRIQFIKLPMDIYMHLYSYSQPCLIRFREYF